MEGDSRNPVYIKEPDIRAPFEISTNPEIVAPDDIEFLSFRIRDSINEDLLQVLSKYGIDEIQKDPRTLLQNHFERYL